MSGAPTTRTPAALAYLRPGFFPVPARLSVSPPDEVVTATVADRVPIAAGENVMLTVHDAPAASAVLAPQVPRRVNSAGFAPPTDNAVIVSVPPPLLLTVALFVLVLPTTTVPKSIDPGLSAATAGAIVVVAAACDTSSV